MKGYDLKGYDIIGDIHGQYSILVRLLKELGYIRSSRYRWEAPQGRKAIFLGDLVDRGPESYSVIQTVRAMVEAGQAICLMGNHEFNAVCWFRKDKDGAYLREHDDKKRKPHAPFLEEMRVLDGKEEGRTHKEIIDWFASLPLWLDCGSFRCVHACWDQESILLLQEAGLVSSEGIPQNDQFFLEASQKGSSVWHAMERICKGAELNLPEGVFFLDKDGTERRKARLKWWRTEPELKYREAVFLDETTVHHAVGSETALEQLVPPQDRVSCALSAPTFFGHYWCDPQDEKRPFSEKAACLDYSAGRGGPLVAYRWNEGDSCIDPSQYIWIEKENV